MTGATGLIGLPLSLALHKKGHQVIGLTRDVNKAKKRLPFLCSFFEWKDTHTLPPQEAFQDVSMVIHLAGEGIAQKRWTKKRKKRLVDSRVLFTQNLVKRMSSVSSIHTFVSMSAVGYYGDRQDKTLTEDSSVGQKNEFVSNLCMAWEQSATRFQGQSRRVIIFRLGLVLAKQGGVLKKMIPVFQKGLGSVLSNGRQWMSWVHIDDLIQLFLFSIENKNVEGIFNVTTPYPVTNKEFTKTLSQVIGKPVYFQLPRWMLVMLFGEMATLFWHSQRVLPNRIQKKGFVFQYPKLSPALQSLLN